MGNDDQTISREERDQMRELAKRVLHSSSPSSMDAWNLADAVLKKVGPGKNDLSEEMERYAKIHISNLQVRGRIMGYASLVKEMEDEKHKNRDAASGKIIDTLAGLVELPPRSIVMDSDGDPWVSPLAFELDSQNEEFEGMLWRSPFLKDRDRAAADLFDEFGPEFTVVHTGERTS